MTLITGSANNLRLNPQKTRELITRRTKIIIVSIGRSSCLEGDKGRLPSNPEVSSLLNSTFSMKDHIYAELSSSAFSIYALRQLNVRGLSQQLLRVVARETTLATLSYASPAWWGYVGSSGRDRLEWTINKLRRGVPSSRFATICDFGCGGGQTVSFWGICCRLRS